MSVKPLTKRPAPVPPPRPSRAEAEAAVATLLRWSGDDPAREGLLDTPARVARAFEEMFAGVGQDPVDVLGRVFTEVGGYDEFVLVRDIGFASHCEHHLMPFMGKAHVAYHPDGGVVGLSKIARVVSILSHRLQTQERLTAEIADAMETALRPRGVAVMVEAEHLCMSIRGIATPGSITVTSRFTGLFAEPGAQARLMQMLRPGTREAGR